jgi:hypothetical protein
MQPPRPGTIAGDKLCELTGLTDRRHRQLAAEGYFPPPVQGYYLANDAIRGLFRYFRDQLHKKEDSLASERKKLSVARREKLEVEIARMRGDLIDRAEIGPYLRNLGANQRATLQNKLENELSLKLAGLDPIAIRARMAEAVDDLCLLYQQGIHKWLAEAPPEKSGEPPAPPAAP